LTQAKGWRWTFWVLAIAVGSPAQHDVGVQETDPFQAGAVTVVCFLFLRESYAYTILDRKTKRLREETGNPNLRSALDSGRSAKDLFLFSIVRPTKMLFRSPIVFLLSLYVAVVYGYLYLLFTTLTAVFEGQYGFSQGSVGLAYLGIGVGSIIGLFIVGSVSDRLLKYLSEKNGTSKPEFRLPPMIPGTFFIPLALFWYGWTADKHLHWILPIIGTAFLGVGMLLVFVCSAALALLARWPCSGTDVRADDGVHLPCRRLHGLLRLRDRCQHGLPVPRGRCSAARGRQDVRNAWPRLGQLAARVHRAWPESGAVSLLPIRREDPDQQAIPDRLLAGTTFDTFSSTFA